MLVVVLVKTAFPLKLVLLPILSISARMLLYSVPRALNWVVESPPLAASVASVTAVFKSVLTCDNAPSATWPMPIPLLALFTLWFRAAMDAFSEFAICSPAGSSAPVLILEPVVSWVNVDWSDWFVLCNWFCDCRDAMLKRTLSPIGFSFRVFLLASGGEPLAGLGSCLLALSSQPTLSARVSRSLIACFGAA